MLVAGIGNIFQSDDGFGSEVAAALAGRELPPGLEVADVGIRGIHLALQLLDGYDALILVDALPRGGEPGTLYVLEPDLADLPAGTMDAHSLGPGSVLAMVEELGGTVPRCVIVGCEPMSVDDGMGLSAEVSAAVEPAVETVLRVFARDLRDDLADAPSAGASRGR